MQILSDESFTQLMLINKGASFSSHACICQSLSHPHDVCKLLTLTHAL